MTEFHLLRSGTAKLQEAFTKIYLDRQRDWYENEVAKHFPPIIQRWVKEKKNLPFIVRWIARNGYHTRHHYSGKLEFTKGSKILATLEPFKL